MKLTRLGLASSAFACGPARTHCGPSCSTRVSDLLAEAERLGLRMIQLAGDHVLSDLPQSEVAALEAACRPGGIAVELGTRGLDIQDLHHCLALARRLRSPFVRISVERPGDEPTPREIIDRLQLVAAEYRDASVRLALQSEGRLTTGMLLRIVEELGPDLAGVCLDPARSFVALEDPERVVEKLGQHVLTVTLRDFVVRPSPRGCGFAIEGCPAGTGRMNFPWLLDALERAARQPYSAVIDHWVPTGLDPGETRCREREWADGSVAFMCRLIDV